MTNKRAADIINEIIFNYNWHSLTEWKKAALKHAVSVLEKENEPAPAEADTSSNNNNSLQHNDTAKLRICQDVIDKIAKCSSDAWARGYCQAAIDVMEAGGEYAEV